MSIDYMEGRSGIIPGLNLLPTALVNYAGDKQGLNWIPLYKKYGLKLFLPAILIALLAIYLAFFK